MPRHPPSPAVFDSRHPATPDRSNSIDCVHLARPQALKVPLSTTTPGPIVEDTVTRFRYWPFEAEGLAFCRSAISAMRLSLKAFTSKLALPIVQWMTPALSPR